jgi:hypothetical protein
MLSFDYFTACGQPLKHSPAHSLGTPLCKPQRTLRLNAGDAKRGENAPARKFFLQAVRPTRVQVAE